MPLQWTISHTKRLVVAVAKGEMRPGAMVDFLTALDAAGAGSAVIHMSAALRRDWIAARCSAPKRHWLLFFSGSTPTTAIRRLSSGPNERSTTYAAKADVLVVFALQRRSTTEATTGI